MYRRAFIPAPTMMDQLQGRQLMTHAPVTLPRRWRRFSLRSMFLIVTTLCVWLGWFVDGVHREFQAFTFFSSKRHRDDAGLGGRNSTPMGYWIREQIGGSLFARTSINRVDCRSRESLEHLRSLPNVTHIHLHGRKIDDADIVRISKLPGIQVLTIDDTNLSDRGLAAISKMTSLERLSVVNSRISDRGVARLNDLQNLRVLELCRSPVTFGAVAELKRSMPNTIINPP